MRRGERSAGCWVLGANKKKNKRCKRGIVSEALPWILIAVAVLVILMVGILVMKDKGVAIIDMIKDVFKFR